MIIKSKLKKPSKLKNGIERTRLLEDFEGYKLGLICAPAGYGKSTAIADWADAHENVAWFSIDSFDDNPSHFCNYFIHSIEQLPAVSCPASLEMAKQSDDADFVSVLSILFNELSGLEKPLRIILDDYHHIKSPDIHQALAFFIKHMPNHWQVVISSRTMPALSVSGLRIKQQLFELVEADLAFTEQETLDFFAASTDFETEEKKQLALRDNVEGWPTALQLVSILSKDSSSFNECAEQIGKSNHVYLWDYLDEEVFSVLSQELQDLLLHIAPLNKVDSNIINSLCSTEDGHLLLEQLKEHAAFIVPVDKQQDWFTFTSFFKAFLVHKAKQCGSVKRDDKVIAELWLNHQEIAEALPHVLKCQDQQLVIALLNQAGWKLFHDGQLNSLQACFDLIKQSFWLHPELVILKVWMLQSRHQSYKVAPLINQAEKLFAENNIVLSDQLKGEFLVIHAQIAINQGRIHDALAQAEQTLLLLPSSNTRANIVAQAVIGESYHGLGNLELAYQYFQEVKILANEQQMYQSEIWAVYQQTEILQAQSFHQQADQHLEEALSLIKEHHLSAMPLHAFPLHFKAQRAYQAGQFSVAEDFCQQALSVVSPYGEQWLLYTYTLQAKIVLEQDDLVRGQELIEDIERLLRNKNYHSDWIAAANYARLKYWRATEDTAAIERWLTTAPQPEHAFNHFEQCHNRNRVRALIKLGDLEQAMLIVEQNIQDAQQCSLQMEINRNLILLTSIESKLKLFGNAKIHLSQAVESSLFTGLNTCFIRESDNLKPVYQDLAKDPTLIHSVKEKLVKLLSLSGINLDDAPKNPFDSASIIKIKAHARAPRLVKNIPLTPREWQVLGYIHAGYRNHQIANCMGVAPTTVKSHIRNVYQKLGLEDRNEAVQLSEQLVTLLN
ncbi:HTH-type transcriptional regulator MalT [Psychromonas ossibalaenae]|uniref:HTH-type transcriptional regulator MalT n=1 Tax=Psychromonas ossibalaenae TaxID=444922 RepID=UPI000367E2BA|nr:HTH-type transcriptional regulator MalT [Psychromonas ossibalaenae]